MKLIQTVLEEHKAGQTKGMFSICTAHPLVIEASFQHALENDVPFVLIEATSNQVNQDGGYTGMKPKDYVSFIKDIAQNVGWPVDKIVLGGDHLGPNAWQDQTADEAMQKADVLIDQYIRAGFRKIHLDCSMSCANDPTPLSDQTIADRSARLCAIAEKAWQDVGGEAPVYVIGTEVPVPGGAAEDIEGLAVTSAEDSKKTIQIHHQTFVEADLTDAWKRVIATVVQPGVEFDHYKVIDYAPEKATQLSSSIDAEPTMVFEAHSTDYQTEEQLSNLVRDHFAILKVGPGLTFALREALWGLDLIDQAWFGSKDKSFSSTVLSIMKDDPKYWQKYYHSDKDELDVQLQYSFSDRIRYYWPKTKIRIAMAELFSRLDAAPPPDALISQHLPTAYKVKRQRRDNFSAKSLVISHICEVLNDYAFACQLTEAPQ